MGDANAAALATEPWTFGEVQGRVIRTPSYRLFTTMHGGLTVDRLPVFMEAALQNYRSTYATLPVPEFTLDTYVMANRPQWSRLSTQLFRDDAEVFLKIPRGGFTFNGRAVLYDLGTRDTFALVGHEGWHQFTQRCFAEPLPIWLEEGIATHMEGYRWDSGAPARPLFLPWSNPERFDHLRAASQSDTLMPLIDVLTNSPQDLIGSNVQRTLDYYAQAWALVHFLRESSGGKYRDGLARCVHDAAQGGIVNTIRRSFGDRAASSYALHRRGTLVFQLYFNRDIDAAQAEFSVYIAAVVRAGSREKIVAGQSPL